MPFEKGKPNPNAGRKKGSINKGTEQLRKKIAALTENHYPALSEALLAVQESSPKDFIDLYLKLLHYTLPKLESVKQEVEVSEDSINKISIQIVKADTTGSK